MKYLIVAAHPDDEVLGAGGAIYKWTREGHIVDVCLMCTEARARAFRPEDKELNNNLNASSKFLGINKIYEGVFPNIEMNTVPHLKLVQFIESAIKESLPDIVITHHPADTNNEVKRVNEFWYMEVPSCTEWAINNAMNLFRPNCYVEVGKEGVNAKITALGMYRGVMRPYPHPRSVEYITGLATVRGSQWGTNYAEAFECTLRRI